MAGDRTLDAEAAAFRPVDPHVIVLFGITGDLAKRKLLPGLMHLCEAGLMPEFRLIGASRQRPRATRTCASWRARPARSSAASR